MSNVVKTKEVIGVCVHNHQNEDIGKIEELVLDKLSGKVCYAVLSFGGFSGMGDKHFALPWHVLDYNPGKEVFVVNIDKETLKNAPSFSKEQWPDFADKSWNSTMDTYYKNFRMKKAA